jgi:hypothetical protein
MPTVIIRIADYEAELYAGLEFRPSGTMEG